MKNISVQVSLHDKFQIELKFICPIKSGKKIGDYHIELYFFMPRNLEVSDHNFGTEQFYNDFYEHIRFQTPQFDLAELVSADSVPLARLRSADSFNNEEFSKVLKMFCSIAKSAIRDSAGAVERAPAETQVAAAEKFLLNTETLLEQFRSGRPESASAENLELFDLVDEFLSITANSHRYKIWESANDRGDEKTAALAAKITGYKIDIKV